MQIILERDSIDNPPTFNVCRLQLIFHTSVFTYYIFMLMCFQSKYSNTSIKFRREFALECFFLYYCMTEFPWKYCDWFLHADILNAKLSKLCHLIIWFLLLHELVILYQIKSHT